MWREISQPNLRDERQLGASTIKPYRVSLFALRRIFQVAHGDEIIHSNREKQGPVKSSSTPKPMAKPNSLLLVRSSLDEDYLFEASCQEERDVIVHLLKMSTARLVSHAVSGNGDAMIKEYFNEDFVSGGKFLATGED